MKEKVSIIIPTYKGSTTVCLACKSAIHQTYENTEIIVVDDNGEGTEEQLRTEKVLAEYIENHTITYLCHKKNMNGSAARNTGLWHSTGEYVCFLDDDDVMFRDKIEKQAACLTNTSDSIALCVCDGYYVRRDGVGYHKKIKHKNDFMYYYMMDINYFNTTAILFKAEPLKKIGGFDDSFKRHQDWEVCCRILSGYDAVAVSEALMVRYLENRNNPANLQIRDDQLNFFFDKITPYMQKKLSNKQVKRIITHKHREICQAHIVSGEIKKALKYGGTYSNNSLVELIAASFEIVYLLLRKTIFGKRKVVYSREEVEVVLAKCQ